MVTVKFKKLSENAKIPNYAKEGDAGMDVFTIDEYELKPNERKVFKTGISMEIEPGYVALVWDKSGLAAKAGIKTMAGVIDSGYRGELGIVLFNTSKETKEFKTGDKIAQILIQPIVSAKVEEVTELSDSERGSGGFGSTGR